MRASLVLSAGPLIPRRRGRRAPLLSFLIFTITDLIIIIIVSIIIIIINVNVVIMIIIITIIIIIDIIAGPLIPRLRGKQMSLKIL